MTNFHEVLFPLEISLNTEGGPVRRTDIVTLASGHEERNTPLAHSRRSYNVGYGVKSLDDIALITAFFEARRGQLYGFRFRDPFDHRSCQPDVLVSALDQEIGTGDGTTTRFALRKRYESGEASYARPVPKPVSGTVVCAVAGGETATSLDLATGEVIFASAPPAGAAITAGFEFDTPVRFDTDSLRINLAGFRAGDVPSVPLREIFL
ncbi:MAG: DUF2460 domain-containing protein [Pseudomonadota bacterium]